MDMHEVIRHRIIEESIGWVRIGLKTGREDCLRQGVLKVMALKHYGGVIRKSEVKYIAARMELMQNRMNRSK